MRNEVKYITKIIAPLDIWKATNLYVSKPRTSIFKLTGYGRIISFAIKTPTNDYTLEVWVDGRKKEEGDWDYFASEAELGSGIISSVTTSGSSYILQLVDIGFMSSVDFVIRTNTSFNIERARVEYVLVK